MHAYLVFVKVIESIFPSRCLYGSPGLRTQNAHDEAGRGPEQPDVESLVVPTEQHPICFALFRITAVELAARARWVDLRHQKTHAIRGNEPLAVPRSSAADLLPRVSGPLDPPRLARLYRDTLGRSIIRELAAEPGSSRD